MSIVKTIETPGRLSCNGSLRHAGKLKRILGVLVWMAAGLAHASVPKESEKSQSAVRPENFPQSHAQTNATTRNVANETSNTASGNAATTAAGVLEKEMVKFQRLLESYKQYETTFEKRAEFARAVKNHHQALKEIHRADAPVQWARLHVLLAQEEHKFVPYATWPAMRHFENSVSAYRAALEVYTQEAFPKEWLEIQNNLGAVLSDWGGDGMGDAGSRLLGEAAIAYRAVMEIWTRDNFPQKWAETQEKLGDVLYRQGRHKQGKENPEENPRLLAESAAALRSALEIYTRKAFPIKFAEIQIRLGGALYSRAFENYRFHLRSAELLAESEAAYHAALEVYTSTDFPAEYLKVKKEIRDVLRIQIHNFKGMELLRFSKKIDAINRDMLEVQARLGLRKEWVETMLWLSANIKQQADISEGAERARLLGDVIAAVRAALMIQTYENSPKEWPYTQRRLGDLLSELAAENNGAERARLLSEAATAYRKAIRAMAHANDTGFCQWVGNRLGMVLRKQTEVSEGAERARLLGESSEAYHAALDACFRKRQPSEKERLYSAAWLPSPADRKREIAEARRNLGVALCRQAMESGDAEKLPPFSEFAFRMGFAFPARAVSVFFYVCVKFYERLRPHYVRLPSIAEPPPRVPASSSEEQNQFRLPNLPSRPGRLECPPPSAEGIK